MYLPNLIYNFVWTALDKSPGIYFCKSTCLKVSADIVYSHVRHALTRHANNSLKCNGSFSTIYVQ